MPTPLAVLRTYFNTDATKKPLKEFAEEIKQLTDADKMELATLAAADLGVTLDVPKPPDRSPSAHDAP